MEWRAHVPCLVALVARQEQPSDTCFKLLQLSQDPSTPSLRCTIYLTAKMNLHHTSSSTIQLQATFSTAAAEARNQSVGGAQGLVVGGAVTAGGVAQTVGASRSDRTGMT